MNDDHNLKFQVLPPLKPAANQPLLPQNPGGEHAFITPPQPVLAMRSSSVIVNSRGSISNTRENIFGDDMSIPSKVFRNKLELTDDSALSFAEFSHHLLMALAQVSFPRMKR
jgi:hypothetical protein